MVPVWPEELRTLYEGGMTEQERDIIKATKMRLLGEDEIYVWEYQSCLRRIRARERLKRRRSLRTKGNASPS